MAIDRQLATAENGYNAYPLFIVQEWWETHAVEASELPSEVWVTMWEGTTRGQTTGSLRLLDEHKWRVARRTSTTEKRCILGTRVGIKLLLSHHETMWVTWRTLADELLIWAFECSSVSAPVGKWPSLDYFFLPHQQSIWIQSFAEEYKVGRSDVLFKHS